MKFAYETQDSVEELNRRAFSEKHIVRPTKEKNQCFNTSYNHTSVIYEILIIIVSCYFCRWGVQRNTFQQAGRNISILYRLNSVQFLVEVLCVIKKTGLFNVYKETRMQKALNQYEQLTPCSFI